MLALLSSSVRFLLFTLLAVLGGGFLGYATPPSLRAQEAPRIALFRASSPSLYSGETVRLSWRLTGGKPDTVRLISASGVVTPSGNEFRLSPDISQTYTLVVENRQGSDQKRVAVEVLGRTAQRGGTASGGASSGGKISGGTASGTPSTAVLSGGAATPTLPEGTFGVSSKAEGPFLSDEAGGIRNPGDKRIVRVAPGGIFFTEVNYQDPEGIARIDMILSNGLPAGLSGTLDRPPFTVVGPPRGDCGLERLATSVRCRYRIRVGREAQNIDRLPGAGSEFAYVLRVRVQDGAGNSVNRPVRGYVAIRARP